MAASLDFRGFCGICLHSLARRGGKISAHVCWGNQHGFGDERPHRRLCLDPNPALREREGERRGDGLLSAPGSLCSLKIGADSLQSWRLATPIRREASGQQCGTRDNQYTCCCLACMHRWSASVVWRSCRNVRGRHHGEHRVGNTGCRQARSSWSTLSSRFSAAWFRGSGIWHGKQLANDCNRPGTGHSAHAPGARPSGLYPARSCSAGVVACRTVCFLCQVVARGHGAIEWSGAQLPVLPMKASMVRSRASWSRFGRRSMSCKRRSNRRLGATPCFFSPLVMPRS